MEFNSQWNLGRNKHLCPLPAALMTFAIADSCSLKVSMILKGPGQSTRGLINWRRILNWIRTPWFRAFGLNLLPLRITATFLQEPFILITFFQRDIIHFLQVSIPSRFLSRFGGDCTIAVMILEELMHSILSLLIA